MKELIKSILVKSNSKNVKSIAMSCLGSGNLGYPVKDFVNALKNGVRELENLLNCSLTEITVCEFNDSTFKEAKKMWEECR